MRGDTPLSVAEESDRGRTSHAVRIVDLGRSLEESRPTRDVIAMRRSVRILLALLLGLVLVGPPALAVDSDPGPGCATDWIAAAKSATGTATPIVDARAGRNDCYDRFVVDLTGAATGYLVQYVNEVRMDGSGFLVPLRGAAKLQVVVRSPAYDLNTGTPTYAPADADEAVDVTGFTTFRQVAFAGSFEGQTTFGLGLRARLPFRVFTLAGPGAGSRLIVDVAHAWTGSPGPQGASPVGHLDGMSGVPGGAQMTGWTIDPDTTGPIYAWVTVDGVGRHLYANLSRPDVAAAFPGYGPSHGFSGMVPASAGSHTVCVTASNVGPGSHTPLGCRVVDVL